MVRRMRAPAALALALLASMALAQQTVRVPAPAALAARFPAGAINSVEVADKALAEEAAERAGIEAQFASDERACYSTFFATSCLEDAKERRWSALRLVRPVEVEANTFKRRDRVVERDRQLEERRASDGLTVLLSANVPPDQADPSNAPAAENSPLPVADARDGEVRNVNAPVRRARRAVPLKGPKIEQVSEAQKRADNVEAYKRKVAESKARQRDIAEKKSEKERQRADKERTPP